MEDEYDPTKETVEEYVQRYLREAFEKEIEAHDEAAIHGEGKGGPMLGLFNHGD